MYVIKSRLFDLLIISTFIIGLVTTTSFFPIKSNFKVSDNAVPSGMVFVPAGQFIMGSNDSEAEDDERPIRPGYTGPYYIDIYEVTNIQYKEFRPDHNYPQGDDKLPVTKVLKHDAEAYCRFLGKRLPSGVEWEKAARGVDGRQYPWGNQFQDGLANIRSSQNEVLELLPVGSFPEGISPYGVHDMSGNVWEWVSDEIIVNDSFFGDSPDTVRAIVRGGAYRYSLIQARTSHQGFEEPELTCNDIGFRCVKDAE